MTHDHVNPQCNIYHYERIPNWSKLFHGSTSLACLELKSFSNFSPRPLPRNSVWINRDRYLAFLNIWRLTDSAGAFDTWAPMFCEKPTIVWWSNTAGTSPYVLVETRSPSSGWNLPTSYVCLPEVYCNASCNCYDCYKVRFTLSLKEATKSSIRTWRTYSHI